MRLLILAFLCASAASAAGQPVTAQDLQVLINAGGVVHVPAGRYVLPRAGGSYHALSIPAGVTLVGESRDSVILQLAPGTAPSVRLLEVVGAGVTIESLTLDGDRAEQDPGLSKQDGHRAGIFARAPGVTVRDVLAQNFTGDGVYGYNGADGLMLERVVSQGNGRNGTTLGGMVDGVTVTDSTFQGNGAQQFDSEIGSPGHVDHVRITGSTFDGLGVSTDYVLTICGSAGAQSRDWLIEGNTINGALYAVWASDIVVRGNVSVNPTVKPWLVYRTAVSVAIEGNDLTAVAAQSAIAVIGTGTGQAASEVSIRGNRIVAGGTIGVRVDGAISIAITGNAITTPRSIDGSVAIALRATNPAVPFASAKVAGNTGSGWSRGLAIAGVVGSTTRMTFLDAGHNRLGAPMALDDGSGALQRAILTANEPADVSRWPQGAVLETMVTMTRSP